MGKGMERKKEKEKARARVGKRVGYDLPPDLINAMAKLAQENETTASQLAALAISEFLKNAGRSLDLERYKVPVNNPRYSFLMSLDPKP